MAAEMEMTPSFPTNMEAHELDISYPNLPWENIFTAGDF